MPRHAQIRPARKQAAAIAAALSGVAAGALITMSLTASGATTGSPNETCSFHVSNGIVGEALSCTPDTTIPPTTTTSPSSTPPPTTANSTPTHSAPSSVGFPNATDTGVPAGTKLTASRSITVTVNGQTITNMQVTGCITIAADDVTIENTRILGGGCSEPIHNVGHKNLVVQDSEIDGEGSAGECVGAEQFTLQRDNIHGCSDGIRVAYHATVTVKNSWIHDMSLHSGDHNDGVQFYESTGPAQFVHNTIEPGSGPTVNAAFFTADNSTGTLLLEQNLMSDGGYVLRIDDNTATVTNNLIVNGTWGYAPVNAFYGDASDPGATIVAWSNNRICGGADGSSVGALIPQP